ncbi:MAG: phosphatidylserine decarboxylase [Elusimicrobia bacterium]|nr:phosphatidylserine decarboxylase [Elusimicrobiota bacterium]
MSIALEGLPFILAGFAAAAIGYLLPNKHIGAAMILTGVLFAGFCAFFFRNPERITPKCPATIYSPGDGTVLSVAKEGTDDGETIRIFLSLFDVHIQRAPCAGTVEEVRYEPGTFLIAMKPGASKNERNVVRISPEGRKENLEVEQIAGILARRIRCWVKKGDKVAAGERYGLIQFGSQAALRLPPGAKPVVKPGDKVYGGLTPVAEWRDRG